jgi:16S rRNA C967 or C1407 C5-methylase (RsmB/RsmF family)
LSFDLFNSYFLKVYGSRWENLLGSLRADERQVARKNRFTPVLNPGLQEFPQLSECYEWSSGELTRGGEEQLFNFYVMDPASVVVARALQVQPGDEVLDMCAAPGGKTLILAEDLFAVPSADSELTANEISADRRDRLKKVIQQYIPREIRNQVWVSSKDGGLFAVHAKNKFNKILLDAPCSGERHLLQHANHLEQWSESRSKKLAQRQYALLTAALEAAKPGGRIVYSTCSISPLENDSVVERVLAKKKGRLKLSEYSPEIEAEKTICGFQYFPDEFGFGPLYFAVLEKLS